VTFRRIAASSRAGPEAEALAVPPATTMALPAARAISSASDASASASTPAGFETASIENGASAAETSASGASGPICRVTINSRARAAATAARCESRTRIRRSAFAPVSVSRPSSCTKRLIAAAPCAGDRRDANSRSNPSSGRSRNSAPNPTMRLARSRRGRATLALPNACCQATPAAPHSSGDQATWRSPVFADSPAIAASTAGLETGPASSTAFGPAAFSLATTSAPTAAQLEATGAPFPRLTDNGPRARSGS